MNLRMTTKEAHEIISVDLRTHIASLSMTMPRAEPRAIHHGCVYELKDKPGTHVWAIWRSDLAEVGRGKIVAAGMCDMIRTAAMELGLSMLRIAEEQPQ